MRSLGFCVWVCVGVHNSICYRIFMYTNIKRTRAVQNQSVSERITFLSLCVWLRVADHGAGVCICILICIQKLPRRQCWLMCVCMFVVRRVCCIFCVCIQFLINQVIRDHVHKPINAFSRCTYISVYTAFISHAVWGTNTHRIRIGSIDWLWVSSAGTLR